MVFNRVDHSNPYIHRATVLYDSADSVRASTVCASCAQGNKLLTSAKSSLGHHPLEPYTTVHIGMFYVPSE